MTKILVTGASGYIGSKIYKDLQAQKRDVIGIYKTQKLFPELEQLDLIDREKTIPFFKRHNPQIIIHTVANASSRWCEKHSAEAYKINVETTKNIVEAAKIIGAKVIYISTFACYNATNIYGKNKLEAENIIKTLPNYLIVNPK